MRKIENFTAFVMPAQFGMYQVLRWTPGNTQSISNRR